MFSENMNGKIIGHIRIWEEETGKILLDEHNAIHPENMSVAIAEALSHGKGFIREMVFGNGGVRVNASNEFLYSAPQTIGRMATLYNQTYSKIVDQNDPLNDDVENNFMEVSHITGNVYSDILVHCTLNKGEPSSQDIFNRSVDIANQEYQFSEIGLKTYNGDLITHRCHYPIEKSLNITLKIDYNLRMQIV